MNWKKRLVWATQFAPKVASIPSDMKWAPFGFMNGLYRPSLLPSWTKLVKIQELVFLFLTTTEMYEVTM